jgi:low affinity Fe/Cu permease
MDSARGTLVAASADAALFRKGVWLLSWAVAANSEGLMSRKSGLLEGIAHRATIWTGSSWGFTVALAVIVAWALTGPLFGFSDTWQLVINTSTTIVTFLMVFLIQRFQNKDAQAIHLKLNELVAAVHGASNRLINVEDLSEGEMEGLHRHYNKLVELAKAEQDLTESHSVEEARSRHHRKLGAALKNVAATAAERRAADVP